MTTQRYNPTTPGVLGQKVYCTHWMRTGECDFTQQGCMFLHAMPDLDTLELLGFRSYPRWFREMPRDFQVMNAKDFQDVGLDQHRHAQKAFGNIPIDANWSNTANRYLPQRGPSGAGYPYLSQPPPMMHVNRAPWPQSGYNQPQLQSSQQDHSSYAHLPYNRPYTPDAFGNVQHYPPGYRGPPTEPALLSRTATPSMDILNRVHKPLSPEIASSQASPMHLAIAGPPGIDTSVPLPFHPHGMPNRPTNQQRQNNGENRNPNHGNPRANTPSSAQVRGKQSRRQGQNKDQKAIGTTTDKNPYSALAIEGAPVHGSTDN